MAKKREARFIISAENKTGTTISKITGDVSRMGKSFVEYGKKAALGISAIGASGLVAAGVVAKFTKQGLDMADSLRDASQRLGIGVTDLQAYQLAAEKAGIDMGQLTGSINKLNKAAGDVKTGGASDKLIEAFERIGISVEEVRNSRPDELFEKVVDGLGSIEDPATKASTAMQIFGKSGSTMLTLVADGAKALPEAKKLIEDLGLALSSVDADNIDAANDALADLKLVSDAAKIKLAAELAPAIKEITEELIDAAKEGEGLGVAIARGVRTGIDSLKTLRQSVRTVIGGTSAGTAVAMEDKTAVLITSRIEELQAVEERINQAIAGGDTITGGGNFDIAREFGNATEAITGMLNLEKAAMKVRLEIQELKAQMVDLPAATVAEAEANKELIRIQDQRRAGMITEEEATATSDAIRKGLESQTAEMKRQADLEAELLAKEEELLKYEAEQAKTQERKSTALMDQNEIAAETAKIAQEIEDAGGTVLPLADFEAMAGAAQEVIPPVEELVDVIATGPESVVGAIEQAKVATTEFKDSATSDIKTVRDDFKDTFSVFEEYGKAATSSVESAIDEFARSGKFSVKDFAASVLSDLAAITAKAAILGGIFGNSDYGGNGTGGLIGSLVGAFTGGTGTGAASYAGGGFTGYGSRSGGVDGRGGFPAILHPNETVVDHSAGQGMSGTVNYSPTIIVRETMPAGQARAIIREAVEGSKAAIAQIANRGGKRRQAYGLG